MSYIDILDAEIVASGEDPAFTGPTDQATIAAFESRLGVNFPTSYKEFLTKYGALSFAGDTYYGVTKTGSQATTVPSVIFATESSRSSGVIDEMMVLVKSSGSGPVYSIDTSQRDADGESPVVETELSFKRDSHKKILFESFKDFILHDVRQAVSEL